MQNARDDVILCTGAPAVSDCGVGQWFDSEGTGACEPCGSCKDADDCDVQTGVCPNGCVDWYFPANTCNRYVVGKDKHNTFIPVARKYAIRVAIKSLFRVIFEHTNTHLRHSILDLRLYFTSM